MQHISDLLYKYATGSLSENEKAELEAWVEARPERRIFLERLASPQWLETDYHRQKAIDVEKAISEMKTRISLADNSELKTDRYDSSQESDSNSKTAHTSRFAILNSHLYRVAAVLVLLLVGGTFWYREHTRVTPPTISEEIQLAMEQSRITGRQAAEVINGDEQTKVITRQELTRYHVDEHFAEQLAEAKRITTYQDKEYWVTLEDGTLVHLNYNSRLSQFVVHTPQGDIKVYGTEFWVNTRADVQASQESTLSCQLALVRGSISFTPIEGKETMLKSGQELSIVDSQLSITDVDTAPYIAWNEGKFFFDEWPLERIMQVMARWYGREVEFKSDDIKQLKYSGNFDRYEDIHPTMEAIEAITGLKITINPKQIIIEP